MAKLRIEQRKGETADIFALRGFVAAMPQMSENELWAAARWIYSVSESKIARRKEMGAEIAFGRVSESQSVVTTCDARRD